MKKFLRTAQAAYARLRGDRRGVLAVEFALSLPLFIVLMMGLLEIGRAVQQTTAVQKGLRAGALYAARHEFPLSSATETEVENLVKYGDKNGGGEYLVPGWGKGAADLEIDVTSFNVDGVPVGGQEIPVVRLTASVPFVPMLTDMLPVPDFSIEVSHDQAYVGD
jgi:hypothetical protein